MNNQDFVQAYVTNPCLDYSKVFDVIQFQDFLDQALAVRFLDAPYTRVVLLSNKNK